jgi:hypothetical protein
VQGLILGSESLEHPSLEKEKQASGFLSRYELIIVILNIIYKALPTTLVKSAIKSYFRKGQAKGYD